MDAISTALTSFKDLSLYEYKFRIAYKKQLYDLELNFDNEDFYHCAGLQYLKDIDIPKNASKLFREIVNGKITDDYLEKSKKYPFPKPGIDVQKRILHLGVLRKYIEADNAIWKYVKEQNVGSQINADYMIVSTVDNVEAYIFLRKRSSDPNNLKYCICSFFVNPIRTYNGAKAYWFYKSKVNLETNEEQIYYQKQPQEQ